VKKPRTPPTLVSLIQRLGTERVNELLVRGLPDWTDSYEHWDVLCHKPPPEELSTEEWWFVLKVRRSQNFTPVPLIDTERRRFVYTLPDRVLAMLHHIDSAARGSLAMDDVLINAESRDRYVVSSLIEEAITSSQLEGAATTRPVARDMLRSGRQPRDKDERMILNNYQAMQYIGEVRDELLTPALVLELQRVLTEGTLDNPDALHRRPASADLFRHLLHLGLCHRDVGLILEHLGLTRRPAFGAAAHHTGEHTGRA